MTNKNILLLSSLSVVALSLVLLMSQTIEAQVSNSQYNLGIDLDDINFDNRLC